MPGPGAHNISISSPTKCHYWPENSTYQQVGFCTISLVKGFITLVNTNTVSRLFIIDISIKVVWFPNNKLHFSSIMLLHLVAVVELFAKLYLYIFKYKTDPQNEFSFLVVNAKFTLSFVFAFMWMYIYKAEPKLLLTFVFVASKVQMQKTAASIELLIRAFGVFRCLWIHFAKFPLIFAKLRWLLTDTHSPSPLADFPQN